MKKMIADWSDVMIVVALAGIAGGALRWGYLKYQVVMADGKVTLDEALDVGHELMERIAASKEEIDSVLGSDEGAAFLNKLDELRNDGEG